MDGGNLDTSGVVVNYLIVNVDARLSQKLY